MAKSKADETSVDDLLDVENNAVSAGMKVKSPPTKGIHEIDIAKIYRPKQFRQHFPEAEIEKLMTAINDKGFQGAIVVKLLSDAERKRLNKGREGSEEYFYERIAGDNRITAMGRLGKTKIPADIKPADLSVKEIRRLQADENLVRNDLNPLEEAETILQMMADELDITTDDIKQLADGIKNSTESDKDGASNDVTTSQHVYKLENVLKRYKGEDSKATLVSFIQNLRLLQRFTGVLKEALQRGVPYGKLQPLLGLNDENAVERIVNDIENENLTVRQVRTRVKKIQAKEEKDTDDISQENAKGSEVDKVIGRINTTFKAIKKKSFLKKDAKRVQLEELLSKIESLLDS